MNGIVLAGGLATRLPNKALLPLKDGRPVITSSIDLLVRSCVDTIIIVIPSRSPIPDVVQRLYDDSFSFVIQREALGYPDAVKTVLKHASGDFIVTCCDNVYDDSERVKNINREAYACVRELPSWQTIQLVKWDSKKWTMFSNTNKCFAGYAVFRNLRECDYSSTIEMLNELNTVPLYVNGYWFDIGTLNNYITYWRTK